MCYIKDLSEILFCVSVYFIRNNTYYWTFCYSLFIVNSTLLQFPSFVTVHKKYLSVVRTDVGQRGDDKLVKSVIISFWWNI